MTNFIFGVRMRPGMYAGFSDERGIRVMLDNLLDFVGVMFRRGDCSGAKFRLGEIIEFSCDFVPRDGFEACFEDRADFDGTYIDYAFCVVNALSSELEAEICCGGNIRLLRFSEGEFIEERSDISRDENCGLRVVFRPDRRFFGERTVRAAEFSARVREFTACNAGVKITVCEGEYSELFCCENGLDDYAGYIFVDKLPKDAIYIPVLAGDKDLSVKAVLCFPYLCGDCPSFERVISFANGKRTNQGGAHVEGFLEGVWKAFRELGCECRFSECSGLISGVVELEMSSVPYGGAEKEFVLSDDEFLLDNIIAELVFSALTEYFRENKQAAATVAEMIRQYT